MMRMIMKNKKRRADKQGVILVTILFILALAMIFISCALLLTSATRSRVYDKAEETQARLTLTSAVETFYQAVKMQEIDDAHLIDAAQATSDDETKDWIDLNMGTVNQVPGMRNTKDSKTQVRLVYKAAEKKVYCTFRTQVGDAKTEYAQLVLKEGETDKFPDLFAAQVDYAGNQDNNFRATIGSNAPAGVDDNFIVYRQNFRSNQSEANDIYSDALFLGKGNNVAYFEVDKEHFHGSLVFMDGYKMSWRSTQPNVDGHVFFLGAKAQTGSAADAFTRNYITGQVGSMTVTDSGEAVGQTSRNYAKSNSTWVFANRNANANNANNVMDAIKGAKTGIFLKAPANSGNPSTSYLGSNGTWDDDLAKDLKTANNYSVVGTWKTNYKSDNSDLKKASRYYTSNITKIVDNYPTSSQMFNKYNSPRTTNEATAKGYTSLNFSNLASSGGEIAPGKYIIDGGTYRPVQKVNSSTPPKVIFINGSADTYIFVKSSITLVNVIFVVYNPSAEAHQYFILAQGADMTFSATDGWDNGGIIGTGFLSVPRSISKETFLSNLSNGNYKISSSFSGEHDGKKRPTMNIYGMGSNKVEVNRGTIIEGYLGLFEDNYNDIHSSITFMNLEKGKKYLNFYGRIMATVVFNTSGDFEMPYCPGPSSQQTEEWTEYKSKYRALSVKYFYNSGETGD